MCVLKGLARLKAQGQSTSIQQLKQIFMRLLKGEVGVKLTTWRMQMQDATAVARLRAFELSTALKQLGIVVLQLMKGDLSMALTEWRMQMRVLVDTSYASV